MERTITVRVEVEENKEAIELVKRIEELLQDRPKRIAHSVFMYGLPRFYEGGSTK